MAERSRYGRRHQHQRRAHQNEVATGTVRCARGPQCKHAELVNGEHVGGLIAPADDWDLGHNDHDRTTYAGPEHAACNRATKAHQQPRRRPPEQHPGTQEA